MTTERRQDLVGGLDPDEGLAGVVPVIQEALDGVDQGPNAGVGAEADSQLARIENQVSTWFSQLEPVGVK